MQRRLSSKDVVKRPTYDEFYAKQKHADCSEDFYKETVMEDINSRPVDEEDKRKLLEMLKRLNELEDTGGLNC